MITVHQAEQLDYLLRGQGRPWHPVAGDRFVIPGRDLDEVFVIADMTIEVADLPTGRLIHFNGTTEWALDSIAATEVLWLPWEHQLRVLLGGDFVSLTRRSEGSHTTYVVTLADASVHLGADPEDAYVAALLASQLP